MFIWVYGLDDHLVRGGAVGILTRVNCFIEKILRPTISIIPRMLRDLVFMVMTLTCHALIKSRVKHKKGGN